MEKDTMTCKVKTVIEIHYCTWLSLSFVVLLWQIGSNPEKGYFTQDTANVLDLLVVYIEANIHVKPGHCFIFILEQRSFLGSGKRYHWNWLRLMSRKYKKQLEPLGKWIQLMAWRAVALRARGPMSQKSLVSPLLYPRPGLNSVVFSRSCVGICKWVQWSV